MRSILFAAGAVLMVGVTFGWEPAKPLSRDTPMLTEWGEKVTPENAWREYPRPQMRRTNWTNLNGLWNYAIVPVEEGIPEKFDGEILVPYPVGSSLSGVTRYPGHTNAVWYSRTFKINPRSGERLLLHIDGSDLRTQVFVNGTEATDTPHETAQLALTCDITDFVKAGENRIDIQAWDPMGANNFGYMSYGKQLLVYNPCYYTPMTGIWAPVWLEVVPKTYISRYKATPKLDEGAIEVEVEGVGDVKSEKCVVEALADGKVIASAEVREWGKAVSLELPRPIRTWSPESPYLYGLRITLGKDVVSGYFGMRKFEVKKDPQGVLRFFLNNEVYFAIGTLDQGWWPDGLLTPPSDAAMEFDIMALKKMGFNMMRKHIKVEPMRYYYLCDKLGILVLQDMPSGHGDINGRYGRYRQEWKGLIDQLYNVPSIVMWIPYNERWGQPKAAQTSWTLKWTKRYDPSRVIDGPSGWSDYEGGFWKSADGKTLTPTSHLPEGVPESADVLDFHNYPGPKMLPVNSHRATFIGEFGGLGLRMDGNLWKPSAPNWGYGGTGKGKVDPKAIEDRYLELMEKLAVLASEGLAGSVYTQTTDVEHEINGLITYDRKLFKFDCAKLKAAHDKVIAEARRGALTKFVKRTLIERRAMGAWRYSVAAPSGDWTSPAFDDSSWPLSNGGFGSKGMRENAVVATQWTTKELYLRTEFTLDQVEVSDVLASVYHDEDCEIFLNGVKVLELKGYNHDYDLKKLDAKLFQSALKPGRNILAVKVIQTIGGQYFDMDLTIR